MLAQHSFLFNYTPFNQRMQKRLKLSLKVEVPGEKVKIWAEEMAQLLGTNTTLEKNPSSVLQLKLKAYSHLEQQLQENQCPLWSQRAHAPLYRHPTETHIHLKLKIKMRAVQMALVSST